MSNDRFRMQDPRSQYPKPPFEKQPQPAPGLATEMRPKPDHGEESYTGSGRTRGLGGRWRSRSHARGRMWRSGICHPKRRMRVM